MSPALRVALSIAVIRLPCSDAAFSSIARKIWTATLRGSKAARISSSSGSYSTPRAGGTPVADATAPPDADRDDLLADRLLHQSGLEARVEQVHHVDPVGHVAVDQILGDRLGIGEAGLLDRAGVVLMDDLLRDRGAGSPRGPCGRPGRNRRSCPRPISSSALRRAARTMFELNAPASPRSEVQTTSRWFWSLPVPASSFGLSVADRDLGGEARHHRLHALGIGTRRPPPPAAHGAAWRRRPSSSPW